MLNDAIKLQDAGKNRQLASLEFSCKAGDDVCNRVHLIKGNACLILAKAGETQDAMRADLSCAAGELSAGINSIKAWDEVPVDRHRVYENACEAARLRADYGDRARYEALLGDVAGKFSSIAPDHPGAIYYNARADFYTLTQSQNPCDGLKTLRQRVDSAMQRFQTDPRYGQPYQALRGTVAAEQTMRCGQ